MFNNPNETVGDDGHINLNAYGVLRFTPEDLDSKVLLNPFEEEPDLPSIAVHKSGIFGIEVEVVDVVGKDPLQFRRIVDDSPEFRRIVGSIVLPNEEDCLVSDDIVLTLKEVFSRNDFICRMPLLTNDKECYRKIDGKEARKLKYPLSNT